MPNGHAKYLGKLTKTVPTITKFVIQQPSGSGRYLNHVVTKFNRIATVSPGTQRHHWGMKFNKLKYIFEHTTIDVRATSPPDWALFVR